MATVIGSGAGRVPALRSPLTLVRKPGITREAGPVLWSPGTRVGPRRRRLVRRSGTCPASGTWAFGDDRPPRHREGRSVGYARRQQYHRLSRAAASAVASGASVLLAVAVAGAGAVSAAGAILVLALGLGLSARHWLQLAGRSAVGARSEDEVRRALVPLRSDGWRLRHSLPWRGRGDIDSLAVAPTSVAFVIETKPRVYDDRHLARVREQAEWLSRRRRRWCRRGAMPVICVVRARGVQRLEQNVLVVSIDRLVPVPRGGVGALGMRDSSNSGTLSNQPGA